MTNTRKTFGSNDPSHSKVYVYCDVEEDKRMNRITSVRETGGDTHNVRKQGMDVKNCRKFEDCTIDKALDNRTAALRLANNPTDHNTTRQKMMTENKNREVSAYRVTPLNKVKGTSISNMNVGLRSDVIRKTTGIQRIADTDSDSTIYSV